MGYEFTFQKESTQNGWTISLIMQRKIKTYLPAVKTPDWYDPDYKNETTPESIKELERIKQESLDRMKTKTKKEDCSSLKNAIQYDVYSANTGVGKHDSHTGEQSM